MEFSRRTFIKMAAIGGASFATENGVRQAGKLVPYVVPPENLPSVAWSTLATTCRECPAGCGMHIRHREGRITKAEGNPRHPVNRGGLCPRGQSALQGVYDPDRVRHVLHRERGDIRFRPETWDNALRLIGEKLRHPNTRVAVMSRLETGALAEIMSAFLSNFSSRGLVFYEPFHYEPLRKAHDKLFGRAILPYYRLDTCDYILSFCADFLESWISNVQFAYEFSEMHALRNGKTGRFDYIGPRLSMTAGNADAYIPVNPGQEKNVALAMLKVMADENMIRSGRDVIAPIVRNADIRTAVNQFLSEDDLRMMTRRFANAGSAVALAGPAGAVGSEAEQLAHVVALLNYAAGNTGSCIDFSRPHALSGTATEEQLDAFLKGLGEDDLLVLHRTNPVYTRPGCEELLQKAGMIICLGTMLDETASVADWFLPVNNDLESWGEYEPYPGVRSIMQPAMRPLADSLDAGDLLIRMSATAGKTLKRKQDGAAIKTTHEWLRERWSGFLPRTPTAWDGALQQGGTWPDLQSAGRREPSRLQASGTINIPAPQRADASSLEKNEAYLWLWPTIMLFDGRVSNRGWLQETPEPVSTLTWGSWIDVHPKKAKALSIQSGDILELTLQDQRSMQAPARITEEIAEDVVAVPFGQGHSALGELASDRGANAFKILSAGRAGEGPFGLAAIKNTGRREEMAFGMTTKEQHGRELLGWKHLAQIRSMKPGHMILPLPEGYTPEHDLYKPHPHKKHRWAMSIDLQRCIGCGACTVACYAENNIPVVGKKEVIKKRHMPWLRVVPYRHHDHNSLRIGWLPMLCQHCDQAPCEPVCPVYASVHSEEGLNAQIYNRCIGTRYCSNNCPYKVRRFSWLNYQWREPLDWQLNPEVTVRSRGVMEKCTFCVQRIRNAEYRARRENRKVRDGEIIPACAQSCPAKVFTFGDLLDPASQISRIFRNDPRRYQVLQELNTKPAITYLYRILQDKTEA